jgi:hypothetical protein
MDVKLGEYEMPFCVHLQGMDKEKGFTKGFQTMEEAEASATERNSRAETEGLKARYIACAK